MFQMVSSISNGNLFSEKVEKMAIKQGAGTVIISAQIEEEISQLEDDEAELDDDDSEPSTDRTPAPSSLPIRNSSILVARPWGQSPKALNLCL